MPQAAWTMALNEQNCPYRLLGQTSICIGCRVVSYNSPSGNSTAASANQDVERGPRRNFPNSQMKFSGTIATSPILIQTMTRIG